MKFNLGIIIYFSISLFLFALFGFLCCDNREARFRKEIRDLQIRLAESEQKRDTFFIHDSVPVYAARIVEVDKTDYKRQLADRDLIKALQLRVSQVEAENRLLLAMRDTVYLEREGESTEDTTQMFTYHDDWADFSFRLSDGRLAYEVRDSLNTYVAREYRHRFLWWRWGTKGYNVYHVNFNPHSRVVYNKYIKVRK